ncbi:response regulator [Paenibacillus sp. SYP-B3998]|uniref:Response regulator n=1 Tax=Paenibacillus sp. SYP-B3998 TaxID=2678564 RepID=A0A6G3ZYF6_9BACL|nr:response regulator [Paenibacillus sp. SYP-B3998]NEW06724.1 response regulator [Paenibacillus sp. SYP-B3998]
MIKVIIVDDEYLVRERLKISVDWNGLGFEVAGEAADGEEALLLLQHAPIQLAIVDINMPIVDGLAFAKNAQMNYPDLKIVILTGYSSFDFAKTAIQAGVSDYLLKPINMDELLEVLRKMRLSIDKETTRKELQENFQKNVRESNGILRRRFIQLLLDGSATKPSESKLQMHLPKLRNDQVVIIVFSIDKAKEVEEPTPKWKRFAVFNIFSEIFSRMKHAETTFDEEDRTVVLVNPDCDQSDRTITKSIYETCMEAIEAGRLYLKFTVTVGVGGVAQGYDGIAQSYKEAIIACKYKTVYGYDRIIMFDSLPKQALNADLSYIREEMIIKLRLGNKDVIAEWLNRLFAAIKEHKHSLDRLYLTVYELVVTLTIYATENKLDITQYVGEAFNPTILVDELERIEDIEAWCQDIYRNVLEQTHRLKQSTPAKLVEKAKAQIDGHYADSELDLNAVARSIFVNPSYLSRIFKSETGYSFVEYLTKCRMLKAKELMENGCKNLYFVAEMVGYKDSHYFSKCFKKHFSVPPSKFIDNG